jgi:hypothetical protein
VVSLCLEVALEGDTVGLDVCWVEEGDGSDLKEVGRWVGRESQTLEMSRGKGGESGKESRETEESSAPPPSR